MTRSSLRPGDLAAVSLGGAVGALLRWSLGEVTPAPDGLPWATATVNVAGCLVLGGLPVLAAVRRSLLLSRFLGPGVLGGFTTVSAMAAETVRLADQGRVLLGAAYAVGTLVACLVAAALGRALVRRRTGTAR